MNFVKHSSLEGRHALLSPSKWNWINDDEESLMKRIRSSYSQEVGTILHAAAAKRIKYGFKLGKSDKKNIILELLDNDIPESVVNSLDINFIFNNLQTYVNDCIGFKMTPEVVLYYSDFFFGTTDCIKFSEKENLLRIHDLKTGTLPAHMEQLFIYAALFCLEYRKKPYEFNTELRIYQNNEIIYHNPRPEEIAPVMDKIVTFDNFLKRINRQEG